MLDLGRDKKYDSGRGKNRSSVFERKRQKTKEGLLERKERRERERERERESGRTITSCTYSAMHARERK